MATTVDQAFAEFLSKSVNLDSERTKVARNSRDWLLRQIGGLAESGSGITKLYTEKHLPYGSFARKTKIRPLDDIDLMVCLNAQGSTYREQGQGARITINPDILSFHDVTWDDGVTLNSRKVINRFVSGLKGIYQYSSAEIKRNQQAAVLQLVSYEWNFDIVPCFYTTPDHMGKSFYLIPDGEGNWMKTDPRLDRERTSHINQSHNGHALALIRLCKYWNSRPTAPRMGSYLLETIILNYLYSRTPIEQWMDLYFGDMMTAVSNAVLYDVQDYKGIQGNINNLEVSARLSINFQAHEDAARCAEARRLEDGGDMKGAIAIWGRVFGSDFPTYG